MSASVIKSFGWWGEMNVLEAAPRGAQLPDPGTELRGVTPPGVCLRLDLGTRGMDFPLGGRMGCAAKFLKGILRFSHNGAKL